MARTDALVLKPTETPRHEPTAPSIEAVASVELTPAATGAAAPALSSAPPPTASAPPDDGLMLHRVNVDFSSAPPVVTVSFDGSQRFSMWAQTMAVAREMSHRRRARFTYFINSVYLDPDVKGSGIGKAHSREEVLVRRALMQIAINEGHDIGNHGVRHEDGGRWSKKRWAAELAEFHQVTDRHLFEPVFDARGEAVFPRFASVAPAGEVGARCEREADCESGRCVPLSSSFSVCTTGCNAKRLCPGATVCGTPTFREDEDVCLPLPQYPVVHEGKLLFDVTGKPGKALRPYRIIGFRAPFLAGNSGLVHALLKRRYLYDASQVSPPGNPLRLSVAGLTGRAMLGFALMQHRGTRTIPMDYNYYRAGVGEKQMVADYQRSIVRTAQSRGRHPWGVGHHFSLWRDGAYWRALQTALSYLGKGCPEGGQRLCQDATLLSYRELTSVVHRAVKRNDKSVRMSDRDKRYRRRIRKAPAEHRPRLPRR